MDNDDCCFNLCNDMEDGLDGKEVDMKDGEEDGTVDMLDDEDDCRVEGGEDVLGPRSNAGGGRG